MMSVRGTVTPRRLSEDAIAALQRGDVDELMRINHAEFGDSVMMAGEPNDDDDEPNDDDGDRGSDDDDKSGDKNASGKKVDDDDDDDSDRESLRRRMKAADKRAADAEKRLKEIEDAKKDDLTKAQDRVTELESENSKLTETVSTLRLENAFLTANTQTWHDPDIALSLASSKGYLEGVTDEETGEVDKKALGKALERLAKEHTYLVKTDKKEDEPPASGEPAGGRSDNLGDDKAKKQGMRNRFPVLNR